MTQSEHFLPAVREALEPFIEALDQCIDESAKDSSDIWESSAAMSITVGNLRGLKRVYANLNTHETPEFQEDQAISRVLAVQSAALTTPLEVVGQKEGSTHKAEIETEHSHADVSEPYYALCASIENNLPRYPSNQAREIACEIRNALYDEADDEGRHYELARWIHALIAQLSGEANDGTRSLNASNLSETAAHGRAVTDNMVQAAINAAWPGNEIVYADEHPSAEAMMRAALEAALKCGTCGGRGEVGGFDSAENGYRTEPCPQCAPASDCHVKFMQTPPPAQQPLRGMDWHDPSKVPPVKIHNMKEFIVAAYRAHSAKVYTFAATYLNEYRLNYEWGCPKNDGDLTCDGCEDGCPTSGWFTQTGEEDDGATYHSLGLKDGDKLMGWRELPQWEESPLAPDTSSSGMGKRSIATKLADPEVSPATELGGEA